MHTLTNWIFYDYLPQNKDSILFLPQNTKNSSTVLKNSERKAQCETSCVYVCTERFKITKTGNSLNTYDTYLCSKNINKLYTKNSKN